MKSRRALLFIIGFVVGVLASTVLPVAIADIVAELDGISAEWHGALELDG